MKGISSGVCVHCVCVGGGGGGCARARPRLI